MRIISQNGEINLPYELTAIFVSGNHIQAVFSGGVQKSPYLMATYSTKEKCDTALKLLDNTYTGIFLTQDIEFEPEYGKELTDMIQRKGFGIIAVSRDSRDVEFKPANIVFRFPEDEEK